MFCQSCGTQLVDVSAPCGKCGTEPPRAVSAPAAVLRNQVKASSRDAFEVLKQLLMDPVGSLATGFTRLGPERALGAGVAMCVAFALAAAGGVVMGANQLQRIVATILPGQLSSFLGSQMTSGGPQGLGAFVKIAFEFLVLPASVAAIGFAIRTMAGARSPVAADVFTAGAALAPLGLAILLGGILGVGNIEIAFLLFFIANAYLMLVLYAGFTRVGEMSERAAAPAVPLAILMAAWLCKVVFAALL